MIHLRTQIDRLVVRLPPLWAAARFVLGAAIAAMIAVLLAKVPPTLFVAGVLCVVTAAAVAALIRFRLFGRGTDAVADAPVVAPMQKELALSIETVAVPLLQFDPAGALVQTNALARGLLDLGPTDLPEPAQMFVDLGRPVRDWIVDVAAGRLPGGSEMVGLRADIRPEDGERFLQVTLQPDGQGGRAGHSAGHDSAETA